MLSERYQTALAIKEGQRKVKLPELVGWSPDPSHRLRPFQELGVAYLYVARKGILADPVGLGKTPQALGLIQLLKSVGKPYRTIVFVRSYNMQLQWQSEIHKFTDLRPMVVDGEKSDRLSQYSSWWEVLICRYSLLLRDVKVLQQLGYDQIICDEPSDAGVGIHHHSTKTAKAIKLLTKDCDRVVGLDATPIQNSLLDMYSLQDAFRMGVFGALGEFEMNYVRREPIKVKRGRSFIPATKIVGYRNMADFKTRIWPYVLRRRISEVEAELPDVQTVDIWLELSAVQRRYYNEARSGLITLWEANPVVERDAEGRVLRTTVMHQGETMTLPQRSRRIKAGFHHLQYSCDTTLAFDRTKPESVKLDWLVRTLTNSLNGRKVIVFAKYLVGIAHIENRLTEAGVRYCKYVGQPGMSKEEQSESVRLFWHDDNVQVLLGTSAMERGLNLQKSAYLINFNQMWNPTRMLQLLGRIRRMGSEHSKVMVVNLLTENTIEATLQKLLRQRAAVADYVWDEDNDLFESLSDGELMNLIQE